MSKARKQADGPIIAGVVLALVVVGLGLYASGYFALSRIDGPLPSPSGESLYVRYFGASWQQILYCPLTTVESWWCDGQVLAASDD